MQLILKIINSTAIIKEDNKKRRGSKSPSKQDRHCKEDVLYNILQK